MIEVVPFKPHHVDLLRLQGVQRAQRLSHVPAPYATVLPGPALTVFEGPKVILCGGIATTSPRMGVLWALLSEHAGRHMVFLHRATLRFIDTEPVRRLEATCEKGFGAGARWLRLLGFSYEGDMPGFGDNGETHERYGRVRWPS